MSSFHFNRWICQVPSPKVKIGIKPRTKMKGRDRVWYGERCERGAAEACWRAEELKVDLGGQGSGRGEAVGRQEVRSRGNMAVNNLFL
jgi:hypothetical protein